jgi:F-type H+-transporting ATPase subunit b
MSSYPVEKSGRSFLLKAAKKASAWSIFIFLMTILLFAVEVYASEGAGASEGPNWKDFFWRSFNFVILAGFFYWLLADKIKDFFSGRKKDIKAALEEAVAAREEAEKKFKEYDAKLDKAAEEIKEMAALLEAQGLAEKNKIIAEAQKTATKMKEDAQKRMELEVKKAQNELRAETVRLSMEIAEGMLKKQITAADHANMVSDYIDKVVTKH